jgi:hypothetical protein
MRWADHIERVGLNLTTYRSIGTGKEGKMLLIQSCKYILTRSPEIS